MGNGQHPSKLLLSSVFPKLEVGRDGWTPREPLPGMLPVRRLDVDCSWGVASRTFSDWLSFYPLEHSRFIFRCWGVPMAISYLVQFWGLRIFSRIWSFERMKFLEARYYIKWTYPDRAFHNFWLLNIKRISCDPEKSFDRYWGSEFMICSVGILG